MIRRKANNNDFLDIFGLSGASKRILLDIIAHGVSSVADISDRLNMPKPSVYDSIAPLLDQSLVNEYSGDHGKTFGISDSEQLSRAQEEKVKEMDVFHKSFLEFIKSNAKIDSTAKPKIKFYSGTLGVKQAFRDMMWQKDITEAYLMWPAKDMLDLDADFFKWHGKQRFQYNVFLNVIQKDSDRPLAKKHEWLRGDLKANLARVRYLPKSVNWEMSFWLYGNKCLFASGGTEKIAFAVHSKEFCQLMKILWENTWEKAKE